jgi:hypothetical protein
MPLPSKSASDIPQALQTFESIRKPRVAILAKYGAHNAHLWQLPDGPEQEARDAKIRKVPMFGTSSWDGITLTRSPACLLIPFSYVLAHDVIDFVSNLWVLIAREDLELTGS